MGGGEGVSTLLPFAAVESEGCLCSLSAGLGAAHGERLGCAAPVSCSGSSSTTGQFFCSRGLGSLLGECVAPAGAPPPPVWSSCVALFLQSHLSFARHTSGCLRACAYCAPLHKRAKRANASAHVCGLSSRAPCAGQRCGERCGHCSLPSALLLGSFGLPRAAHQQCRGGGLLWTSTTTPPNGFTRGSAACLARQELLPTPLCFPPYMCLLPAWCLREPCRTRGL